MQEKQKTRLFNVGDRIRLLFDIKNDGTFFGFSRGDVMVQAGEIGYIRKRGFFIDDDVYEVHFPDQGTMIGCREKELIHGDASWSPACFKGRDKVKALLALTHKGNSVVAEGEIGQIRTVRYLKESGYVYETLFQTDTSQLVVLTENQITFAD